MRKRREGSKDQPSRAVSATAALDVGRVPTVLDGLELAVGLGPSPSLDMHRMKPERDEGGGSEPMAAGLTGQGRSKPTADGNLNRPAQTGGGMELSVGTRGFSLATKDWNRSSDQRCTLAGPDTNAAEGSQDTGFLKTPPAASAL